ncbi:hypothetical protein ERJ75_001409000 [Trypanosoma vivax]|nr:hypothetical protein ERJ75_001409000 [Trypanosoma vivax]
MAKLLQFLDETEKAVVNSSVAALKAGGDKFTNALARATQLTAEARSKAEEAKAMEASFRANASAAREAAGRAEVAAREAWAAATRAATGCTPLHKQMLSMLRMLY